MICLRKFLLLALVAVFTGVGSVCHAQATPVDCMIVPVYDFGDGTALWDCDYYSSRTCTSGCTCTGGPQEGYTYEPSNLHFPQVCSQCLTASGGNGFTKVDGTFPTSDGAPRLKGVERGLPVAMKDKFQFGENLKPYEYTDSKGAVHAVDPKKGLKILLTKWVSVVSNDGNIIPVKLYAIQYDLRRAGLPAEAYQGRSPVRNMQIGFEFAKMPASEEASAPTLLANQIGSYKNSCFVTLDSDSDSFFVMTSRPMF